MKLRLPSVSMLFSAPFPHPVFEAARAATIAEVKHQQEKQLLSLRALFSCDREKAEEIVNICVRRECSPKVVIDLLAMGWTLRQSLKLAQNNITARICHALNKWPQSSTSRPPLAQRQSC